MASDADRAAAELVPDTDAEVPAPRIARRVTAVYLSGHALVNGFNVVAYGPNRTYLTVIGLLCDVTVFAIQLVLCAPDRSAWPVRRKTLTLGSQAALVAVPLIIGGPFWGFMAGPLAGSLLLLLPKRTAWSLYALLTLSVIVDALVWGDSLLYILYMGLFVPLGGFAIYALTRLSDLVQEVRDARETLAEMAVTRERLGVARDLHDLLGLSLSAILAKGEAVKRWVPPGLDRARAETEEVLGATRQALADVRVVADGYRNMSLVAEIRSANDVLEAAGIRTTVSVAVDDLPPSVDTVLATALREGITNALRHSSVTTFVITAVVEGDTASLTLENDGAGAPGGPFDSAGSGSGLGNLQTRLASLGGTFTAAPLDGYRFRLTARVPVEPVKDPVEPLKDPVKPVVQRLTEPARDSGRPAGAWHPEQHAADRPDPSSAGDLVAPRLARTIVLVILAGYAAVSAINVLTDGVQDHGDLAVAFCLASTISSFAVQVLVSATDRRALPARRRALTLGCQILLVAPPAALGLFWGSMAGPLAGSVLLLFATRTGWLLYGFVVLDVLVATAAYGQSLAQIDYFTVSSALTGLVVLGLTRLADLVRKVDATRGALARMAVTRERLRVARDLHDLLGYSLSAITLKGELIYRLIPADRLEARAETSALLEVARQALADVRVVARGYRDMSLEVETESATELLEAAGIRPEVDLAVSRLHPQVDAVLATALREGVTNTLRHSDATVCTIRTVSGDCDLVRLILENDGIRGFEPAAPGDGSGGGLDDLRGRLAALGGTLSTATPSDGRYRLTVEVPSSPPPQKPPRQSRPLTVVSGNAEWSGAER